MLLSTSPRSAARRRAAVGQRQRQRLVGQRARDLVGLARERVDPQRQRLGRDHVGARLEAGADRLRQPVDLLTCLFGQVQLELAAQQQRLGADRRVLQRLARGHDLGAPAPARPAVDPSAPAPAPASSARASSATRAALSGSSGGGCSDDSASRLRQASSAAGRPRPRGAQGHVGVGGRQRGDGLGERAAALVEAAHLLIEQGAGALAVAVREAGLAMGRAPAGRVAVELLLHARPHHRRVARSGRPERGGHRVAPRLPHTCASSSGAPVRRCRRRRSARTDPGAGHHRPGQHRGDHPAPAPARAPAVERGQQRRHSRVPVLWGQSLDRASPPGPARPAARACAAARLACPLQHLLWTSAARRPQENGARVVQHLYSATQKLN